MIAMNAKQSLKHLKNSGFQTMGCDPRALSLGCGSFCDPKK